MTLKEIARQANVSRAVVSYVINGQDAEKRISPATR
ncbi:MAG: LacI family DNA-binding transcriptional regulator, partial [Phycisphaeraceae bacterium]|nr:LacI family DNA-binding transcriptional regulator [Phycisphaeraceae bacterium]